MESSIVSHRGERGQAIVLVVLALVALMGFAALAVDGGAVYSERRRAQNAADSAAYAAAMAAVDGKNHSGIVAAALQQAQFNAYENVNVEVHNPPISGAYAGEDEYYQILITSELQPAFASIVTDQPMIIRAEAISHATKTTALTSGNAVHALQDWGDALKFDGGVNVEVTGGNIYSNANIHQKASSGWIKVNDGQVYYSSGDCGSTCKESAFDPDPEKSAGPLYVAQLPTPSCPVNESGKLVSGVFDSKTNTYYPGTYEGPMDFKGKLKDDPYILKPGIYCLKGGMTLNGGKDQVIGNNVLIVLKGGSIKLNGNGKIKLTRDSDIIDANNVQWGGMLLFVPPTNGSDVSLSGGNGTVFSGTVYAPKSLCEFGGNSTALGIHANIICNKVKFHGDTTVNVIYKQAQNYQLPATLELSK